MDGLFLKLDAVTIPVPDLDSSIAFYGDQLGHRLLWRNDAMGQAGLAPPRSETEIVLSVEHRYEPNWLVRSVDDAVQRIVDAGGSKLVSPFDIPVGRVAVAADPFGNALVLVELSKGRYVTDGEHRVTGVTASDNAGP